MRLIQKKLGYDSSNYLYDKQLRIKKYFFGKENLLTFGLIV